MLEVNLLLIKTLSNKVEPVRPHSSVELLAITLKHSFMSYMISCLYTMVKGPPRDWGEGGRDRYIAGNVPQNY